MRQTVNIAKYQGIMVFVEIQDHELSASYQYYAAPKLDRDAFLEWGIADGLFIDNKQVRTGPPPSFEKIKKKIARKARKL